MAFTRTEMRREEIQKKTYKAEGKHCQRSHRMGQHSPSKDANMHATYAQIPQKIPGREALYHPSSAGVPPYSSPPIHRPPLLVRPHDPERHAVDYARLHERDEVDVPVELGARWEDGIALRDQQPREEGREEVLREEVEGEGDEDLVRVQGQRLQVEKGGEWGY